MTMNRLTKVFDITLKVIAFITVCGIIILIIMMLTTRTTLPSKRVIDQGCTIIPDLRPDEVPAAIKKLNAKNIRVQETQIHLVDGKFYILILDGQDDEEGEEAPDK